MLSAPMGVSASKISKWQQRSESSLSRQLLSEVPPEVELSDYRRLPSSGSESPSGLLNGDDVKAEPIADLDIFFERLYNYYCEKGLWCIIIKWIFEILSVIFMVCFIGCFLLYVDWNALLNAKCGADALEAGKKPCDLAEVIKPHPLAPFTVIKMIIVGSMLMLTVYGLFNFLKFFVQLNYTMKVRHFYYNSLKITDGEIQTIPWPRILEKVVQLQMSQQLCMVRNLSEHDVLMRIMRKENYLIGMLNKGILAFPISWWVPGAGPAVKSPADIRKNHLILPKTLEWTLDWCIFQSMFDSKFRVREDFLSNPSLLKNRLMLSGAAMFLVSPCLVIFMLVYLFLKHAEQLYNHPSTAFSRRWSNLSRWILREFNEVEHMFRRRINNSVLPASNYMMQFPAPLISIIAKFVSFVSGGFAAILIIIALLDESLLEGHIFGRNLFWYAAIFGTMTAISRAAVTDELQVSDPEGAMSIVVQQTHYMPRKWRAKENSELVRREFGTLFQYTGIMLLEEMASLFITPYLLVFVIPKHVDRILRFIDEFTVYVEGVGDVCSLSLFDFERHGNRKYASPFDGPKTRRSRQGKMEKSFLSFQSTYPSWQPRAHDRQFLSNLRTFKEQNMHLVDTHLDYSPVRASRSMSRMRNRGKNVRHVYVARDAPYSQAGYNSGSFWLLNTYKGTHPYLLDWYYASLPPHPHENSEDSLPSPTVTAPMPDGDIRLPLSTPPPDLGKEIWKPNQSGLRSHLEGSAYSAFFHADVLKQHDTEQLVANRWWARPAPSSGPEGSFLEPPTFGRRSSGTQDERNDIRDSRLSERHASHVGASTSNAFLQTDVVRHDPDELVDDRRWGHSSLKSSGPGGSFLEPPTFDQKYIRRPDFDYHGTDVIERSMEMQEQEDGVGVDHRRLHSLSRTTYLDDSDKDEGLGLHFTNDTGEQIANVFGGPLANLPVRIVPRSSDPV